MSESKVHEVPCFGQSFQLGMLYDCRSHQLIPGPPLWESDVIKNASVRQNSPQSKYQVLTSDSLEEKMAILGIDSSLKLSLLTGLVSPSGIANVIFDQKSSKEQARVTLKYASTSKFEGLSFDQLSKGLHRDISEEITATHFVSGIEYGTEAVFIFDRDVDEKEVYADAENDLINFTFDSLSRVPVDDSGANFTLEMDAEKMGKVKCTLYENKNSFKSSMTFEDAIKSYSGFEKNDGSSNCEVPKKVWLHPLSSVDPNIVRPVQEVGAHVTDAFQKIMVNFSDFEIRLSDLFKSDVCSVFLDQKRQITRCEKAVSQYKKNLFKTLSSSLLKVRRGDEEEKILTDVLDKVASSPFHQVWLLSWISGKEKEIRLLSTYLECFKDIQLVLSMEDLDSVVDSLEYDRVVVFSLMTANNQDDLVEQMYTFLRTDSWTQERPAALPWFENPEIIKDIKSKARNFSSFAKENEHDGSTKFIFTNVYKNTEKNVVSLKMHENGHSTDFEPSGKPEKPCATKKTDSSVTLEWKESQHGKSSVQKYTLHFRPADSDLSGEPGREWKSLQTVGPERVITVNGLKAKRAYLFKVSSECKAGRSAFSDTSDSIVTDDFGHPPQTEGFLSESQSLQEKKEDLSLNLSSNEAINSANNLTTPSTSANQVVRAEDKNATGLVPTISTGDTLKLDVSAPYRLAERVHGKSEKVKMGKDEFVSVYKPPMDETERLDGKMIVKKCLNAELDGHQEKRKEKVLLVVGATGAGKSTLINGMVNYILGVEWKDEFRFKIVTEEVSSQANSVTRDITAYTIYPMEGSAIPYVLTIVDTPGFGDTEGLSRDVFITNQIKEFFSLDPPAGIDHLDGIGFVTQNALARLTPTQKYIFDSILSIFGKDVENNFFMMITFADGKRPPVLEAIEEAQITYDSFFKFNNSALFADNSKGGFDEMFWQMGHQSFKDFFVKFSTTNSVSLQLTNEVLKEREQLENLVEGLNPQIKVGLARIEEMRQEKLVLEKHEVEIEHNKEFEYFVPVMKVAKEDLKGTGRHTTTCLNCNFTCHNDCKIADDSQKERCVAMDKDGNCEVCPSKCFWENHKNIPYLLQYKTVQEKRTSEDLKEKYDEAVSGKSRVEAMLYKLEKELNALRIKVLSNMYRVRMSLHRLDEIALKPNPLTEVQYIELLIETEKRECRPGFKDRVNAFEEVKKKAELFKRIKSKDEIPELLYELIPLEEGRASSQHQQGYTNKKRGCTIQ